ncbi:aminotransferase class I/II-fold pyridoxal phosphate-dependent enzyme [uncultured Microbacterium sp.]|uniref:aminotransferase class I/II-fold pyridoxal phosphate-dependent enzyme n=1 Tax=uncultured Microbacterium sp. TaxID=191216 RepID=UPI0035CB6D18
MSAVSRSETFADLTQFEIRALEATFNFADAHTHQRPSEGEQQIVDSLPQLWEQARTRTQGEVDRQFLDTFFSFHGQVSRVGCETRSLLSYAASISMSVVATYLRLQGMSATLIEPCFDNLHDLLVQNQIEINAIDESVVSRAPNVYAALCESNMGDALILVDPNNPTGESMFAYDSNRFAALVKFCVDRGVLLVLDFSFAAALMTGGGNRRPDVYDYLDRTGVSYFTIEDTGKSWATQDLKCGILTMSEDLWHATRDLHTGVILNVSPVSLLVSAAFVAHSSALPRTPLASLCNSNRLFLRTQLEGTRLRVREPQVPVSVAWLSIECGAAAEDTQRELATLGVHVLPGTHFYWSDHERGEHFLRIALARDSATFAQGASIIADYARNGVA